MTLLLAGGGTGGHVFPLIAVADALRVLAPHVEPVFVGTARGLETRIVPERGYRLELMEVLPLRGAGFSGLARGAIHAARSLPEAQRLIDRHQPRAVFSVGGYAAGPISLAARWCSIPLALLEPNAVIGLANRLTAPWVTRAYTAFAEAESSFAPARVVRTGVPIRRGFSPKEYKGPLEPLRVLVLGGSQGAKALNEALPEALARVRVQVRIKHQCGERHLSAVRQSYSCYRMDDRVDVVPFIDDMPEALAEADLVVSRSGASAVSEICAIGRPSLLVPYPFAAGDHQRMNALSLADAGAAVCLSAAAATPDRLASELRELLASPARLRAMALASKRLGKPHAAETIARDLLRLAGLGEQLGKVA